MNITLERIQKSYNPKAKPQSWIIDDVSLAIQSGERFFLLGPSGCGKTTLLRMLAGFHEPDSGTIYFGERRMNRVSPQYRNTAMVFQNYATWPHLTVFENVAYGPRAKGVSGEALKERVNSALATVRMTEFAARKPSQLSGGQQQRVALARALAVKPDILLFDEPLSNLDAKLRLELRTELHRIHRESPTTSVYVTHDQEEALSLADRIAVLNKGRIEQLGRPDELYETPANEFVARFMGEINFVPTTSPLAAIRTWPDSIKKVGIRPERVSIVPSGGLEATVDSCVYMGSRFALGLRLASGETIHVSSGGKAEGSVQISVDAAHLVPIPG